MELITLGIATATVKVIARMWTHDTVFEGADETLADIVDRHVQSTMQRRALNRQFDDLIDQVAERLQPFLSVETRDVPANEMEAAALAVTETLEATSSRNLAKLLELDLDAQKLVSVARTADRDTLRRAALSEGGLAVYDTLLSEVATYITSIADRLPSFTGSLAAEVLARTTNIADLSQQILDALPTSSVPSSWGPGSEDERFENKYRHAVAQQHGSLTLYGVTSQRAKAPYSLSTAYISLSVETDETGDRARRDAQQIEIDEPLDQLETPKSKKRLAAKDDAPEPATLRIENLLEGTRHLLLSGGAGSGKTTLVQWLAQTAMSRPTGASRIDKWQDLVPFVLPLRRFVEKDLPTPEMFVPTTTPSLGGVMPHGWAHRVLESGRGMVLVDGLDEISVDQREDARQWVQELLRNFPKNRVLVTSRSTAVTDSWREFSEFKKATLLPLDYDDTRAFVSHWHAAAREAWGDAHLPDIDRAEAGMLTIIRERTAIRALCTSPLLCALICALHIESGANLPTNRMDVYRTALEMLVHRRDSDRNVNVDRDGELDYAHRELILRGFARWMHENGASDASRQDYLASVALQMERLFRVDRSPTEVAAFLLERSGVLREPIPGRVDFVHRTFLEFLTAQAIIHENSIGLLIARGHEDHWREVVVMAAGHANFEQRERLLRGLLERGEHEENNRPRLFLVAVACMETSPDLDRTLIAELEHALAQVLPPTKMRDAIAVASAGTLAVPMLRSTSPQYASTAAACVRSLALIGGDEALDAIASYSKDSRVTVSRQLIRAWSSFDTHSFAESVLQHSPLDNGAISITSVDQAAELPLLRKARSVYLDLPGRVPRPELLPSDMSNVYGLDISYAMWLTSIKQLPTTPGLRVLKAEACSLHSIAGLEAMGELRTLSLARNPDLIDLSAIGFLPHLLQLDISGTAAQDLDCLIEDRVVKRAEMSFAGKLAHIDRPVGAEFLVLGHAPNLRSARGLQDSDHLRRLWLHGDHSLRELALPEGLVGLRSQTLAETVVSGGERLVDVRLWGRFTPETLDWVCELPKLAYVSVGFEPRHTPVQLRQELIERLVHKRSVRRARISTFDDEGPALLESETLRVHRRGAQTTYEVVRQPGSATR